MLKKNYFHLFSNENKLICEKRVSNRIKIENYVNWLTILFEIAINITTFLLNVSPNNSIVTWMDFNTQFLVSQIDPYDNLEQLFS